MRGRVEVDLKILKRNAESIKTLLGGKTKIFWVVKADAYGHGIAGVCKQLAFADGFCVATLEEGLIVRQSTHSPVLILGKTDFNEKKECVNSDISLSVWDEKDLTDLICITDNMNKCIGVHIAVNTGMNRIGVKEEKSLYKLINMIKSSSKIQIKGVFSHLFDGENDCACQKQRERFSAFCSQFNEGVIKHLTATQKSTDGNFAFDGVRVGLGLYGYGILGVQPCMSVFGEVVCVSRLVKGESVGYGGKFVANEECLVATLSLGYADGISRKRSGGEVLIRGKRRKIVGSICMDFCFALVDGLVKTGDEAVFMGKQGGQTITAEDIAEWEQTIPYEVLTKNKRLPIVYK